MKKILLASIALFSISFGVKAQTMSIYDLDFDQSNPLDCGTLAAGGTNFVDLAGNYLPNTDETITFCPDLTQGTKVSVAFATNVGYEFDIHPSDTMYIYDGPNTSAPLLGAINSGTDPMGTSFQASFENNPSGCLTIRFVSNGANEGTGWVAKVACGNLPQPYYPHLEAFVNGGSTNELNPIDTGYVDVCLGDSILLVAKPQFPYSLETTGFGYSQNLTNIQYEWSIGGVGTLPVNNDSVWFVPPARQGYFIDLRLLDIFPQPARITAKARVSQLPLFTGTGPVDDTVCLGLNTQLIGGVTAQDTVGVEIPNGNFEVGGTFAGLTYLPDGSGVQYQTSVNMTGLGGASVTSANDIQSICIDIEHSYTGDLEIALTCPNGTMVSLFNNYNPGFIPGGCSTAVFLGNDTDQDGGAPGTPVETYCFDPSATNGTLCDNLGTTIPNASGFPMVVPGTYEPDGNFADFIGCPLEGNWTITVQDNLGIDDGYIFQWGIQFDASLYPDAESYQNVVTSDFWTSDPTIITGQSDTALIVLPNVSGSHSYTYNVVDNFGCAYDTTVVLYTIPQPTIFDDTSACNYTFFVTGTSSFGGGVWSSADTSITFLPNPNVQNPQIQTSTPGIYTVTYTDNSCNTAISSTINFINWAWTILPTDTTVCINTPTVLTAWNPSQNETLSWNTGETTESITVTNPGLYIVTVENVCNEYSDSITVLTKLCDIEAPNVMVLSSLQGNDVFQLDYSGIKEFKCTIKNRWGNTIHEYADPANAWNGKDNNGKIVEEGVYFYIIQAVLDNDEELIKHGSITLYH
jgi:subtilisin-like proprotein convertase family protein